LVDAMAWLIVVKLFCRSANSPAIQKCSCEVLTMML
jgi:hypothetical protein